MAKDKPILVFDTFDGFALEPIVGALLALEVLDDGFKHGYDLYS